MAAAVGCAGGGGIRPPVLFLAVPSFLFFTTGDGGSELGPGAFFFPEPEPDALWACGMWAEKCILIRLCAHQVQHDYQMRQSTKQIVQSLLNVTIVEVAALEFTAMPAAADTILTGYYRYTDIFYEW